MIETLIPATAALGVTAMLCLTALRAWSGWLEFRRAEAAKPPERGEDIGLRIELAAVKERLKKLEAIASGVDI